MRSRFRKFIALNSEERRLFIEAYFLLGIMRAAIKFVSFKRLTRSMDLLKKSMPPAPLTEEQRQSAIMVGKAIVRAANHTPWESACLLQSLTAQKMLEKQGIAGVLYLGIKKDENDKEKMNAHSWTQCAEIIITGKNEYDTFTVVSAYGWGRS